MWTSIAHWSIHFPKTRRNQSDVQLHFLTTRANRHQANNWIHGPFSIFHPMENYGATKTHNLRRHQIIIGFPYSNPSPKIAKSNISPRSWVFFNTLKTENTVPAKTDSVMKLQPLLSETWFGDQAEAIFYEEELYAKAVCRWAPFCCIPHISFILSPSLEEGVTTHFIPCGSKYAVSLVTVTVSGLQPVSSSNYYPTHPLKLGTCQ